MTLYAGIDGGQSGTSAAIGDGERVLGRGHAGPADEVGAGPGSTRLREALETALAGAVRDAGLPPRTHFETIAAGISGYEGRIYGAAPRLPADRVILMHDAPIAHAGAFGGGSGVAVIAGTGSVAYARAGDGRTCTAGGWGYCFGDEGSAFWIARQAIERAIDGDGALERSMLEFFGSGSLRALARSFYSGELTRERFASYAARALAWEEIAGGAAEALARLAERAVIELPCALAFCGGLLRDVRFAERVHRAARARLPSCSVTEPLADPAEGALILARQA